MCATRSSVGVVRRQAGGRGAAVGQDRDPVADPADLVEAVRDVDDADALGGQPPDDVEERLDLVVVQDRGRLVHDQQARVVRQRASDRDDLLGRRPQRPIFARGGIASCPSRASSAVASRRIRRGRGAGPAAARGRGRWSRRRSGPRPGRAPGRSWPRRAAATPRGRRRQRLPANRISPAVGSTAPETHLISVDLPAPLGPSRQWTSPAMHVQVDALEGAHARVLLHQPADLEDGAVIRPPSGAGVRWAIAGPARPSGRAAPDRVLVLDRQHAVEAALVEGVDERRQSTWPRPGRGSATSPCPTGRPRATALPKKP